MSTQNIIFIYETKTHSVRLQVLKDAIEANTNSKCFFYDNLESIEKDLNSFLLPQAVLISAPRQEGSCKTVLEYIQSQPLLESTPTFAITDDEDYILQTELLEMGLNDFTEVSTPEAVMIARLNTLLRQRNLLVRTAELSRNRHIISRAVKNEIKSLIATFNTSLGFLEIQKSNEKSDIKANAKEIRSSLLERLNSFKTLSTSISKFISSNSNSVKLERTCIIELVKSFSNLETLNDADNPVHIHSSKELLQLSLSEMFQFIKNQYKIDSIKISQILSNQSYSTLEKPYITTIIELDIYDVGLAKKIMSPSLGEIKSRLNPDDLTMSFVKQTTEFIGGNIWLTEDNNRKKTYIHFDFPEAQHDPI